MVFGFWAKTLDVHWFQWCNDSNLSNIVERSLRFLIGIHWWRLRHTIRWIHGKFQCFGALRGGEHWSLGVILLWGEIRDKNCSLSHPLYFHNWWKGSCLPIGRFLGKQLVDKLFFGKGTHSLSQVVFTGGVCKKFTTHYTLWLLLSNAKGDPFGMWMHSNVNWVNHGEFMCLLGCLL